MESRYDLNSFSEYFVRYLAIALAFSQVFKNPSGMLIFVWST